MRPRSVVATATLTVAVALGALPGLTGSRAARPEPVLDRAAFQTVLSNAKSGGSSLTIDPLDPAYRSAGGLTAVSILTEPGVEQPVPAGRPRVTQPGATAGSAIKPPRYTLSGYATFYDNGTTAMRLPRGTIIRICGNAGCLERVVNDYGPSAINGRIIDLYRPDFFRICGCASWAGTTRVSVAVY